MKKRGVMVLLGDTTFGNGRSLISIEAGCHSRWATLETRADQEGLSGKKVRLYAEIIPQTKKMA